MCYIERQWVISLLCFRKVLLKTAELLSKLWIEKHKGIHNKFVTWCQGDIRLKGVLEELVDDTFREYVCRLPSKDFDSILHEFFMVCNILWPDLCYKKRNELYKTSTSINQHTCTCKIFRCKLRNLFVERGSSFGEI